MQFYVFSLEKSDRWALFREDQELNPILQAESKMPSLSHLSRPMVDSRNLKTNTYDAEVVEVFELDAGISSALLDPEADKSINKMEIRPIEMDYSLFFYLLLKNGRKIAPLSLLHLIDIKTVYATKGVFKRKDRMLELTFLGNKKKRYVAKINFDDKYIDEILKRSKN